MLGQRHDDPLMASNEVLKRLSIGRDAVGGFLIGTVDGQLELAQVELGHSRAGNAFSDEIRKLSID